MSGLHVDLALRLGDVEVDDRRAARRVPRSRPRTPARTRRCTRPCRAPRRRRRRAGSGRSQAMVLDAYRPAGAGARGRVLRSPTPAARRPRAHRAVRDGAHAVPVLAPGRVQPVRERRPADDDPELLGRTPTPRRFLADTSATRSPRDRRTREQHRRLLPGRRRRERDRGERRLGGELPDALVAARAAATASRSCCRTTCRGGGSAGTSARATDAFRLKLQRRAVGARPRRARATPSATRPRSSWCATPTTRPARC